jgi:hypothetical protein
VPKARARGDVDVPRLGRRLPQMRRLEKARKMEKAKVEGTNMQVPRM